MSNSDLLAAGISGAMAIAPVGTAKPADLGALPGTWSDVGWISSDGLKNAIKVSSNEFTPWGASTPARTIVTSSAETFSVTMWETNNRTLEVYYKKAINSLVENASGIYEVDTGTVAQERFCAVFDILDGSNHIRIFLPNCEVTNQSDIVYKPGEIIGYPVDITPYPDSNGNAVYRMIAVGAVNES